MNTNTAHASRESAVQFRPQPPLKNSPAASQCASGVPKRTRLAVNPEWTPQNTRAVPLLIRVPVPFQTFTSIGQLLKRGMKRPNGCVVIESRHRYPTLSHAGKGVPVHRLAWTIAFGPIPPGMCVCHHCDNDKCFNPKHLFLGTDAENSQDKVNKGRQFRKLMPEQIEFIRNSSEGPVRLARRFGVSHPTIIQARNKARQLQAQADK